MNGVGSGFVTYSRVPSLVAFRVGVAVLWPPELDASAWAVAWETAVAASAGLALRAISAAPPANAANLERRATGIPLRRANQRHARAAVNKRRRRGPAITRSGWTF